MVNTYPSRIKRRKYRISKNLFGTDKRPRISVNRSLKYIYVQAIDDVKRKTIVSFSSKNIPNKGEKRLKKRDISYEVGKKLGDLLKEKQITTAVFDRGQFSYLGRVKMLAEGIRASGIIM